MTSDRLREIGASVRHAALTGETATVTIDHKEYRVSIDELGGSCLRRCVSGRDGSRLLAHVEGNTMNDNTTPRDAIEYSARERVAMYIPFCVKDRNIKPRKLVEENWRMRRVAKGMEEQGVLLMRADSAIAEYNSYLWQAADDPEVVEAVADELNFYLLPDDGTSEAATRAAITTLLTALLGPSPNEQEAER